MKKSAKTIKKVTKKTVLAKKKLVKNINLKTRPAKKTLHILLKSSHKITKPKISKKNDGSKKLVTTKKPSKFKKQVTRTIAVLVLVTVVCFFVFTLELRIDTLSVYNSSVLGSLSKDTINQDPNISLARTAAKTTSSLVSFRDSMIYPKAPLHMRNYINYDQSKYNLSVISLNRNRVIVTQNLDNPALIFIDLLDAPGAQITARISDKKTGELVSWVTESVTAPNDTPITNNVSRSFIEYNGHKKISAVAIENGCNQSVIEKYIKQIKKVPASMMFTAKFNFLTYSTLNKYIRPLIETNGSNPSILGGAIGLTVNVQCDEYIPDVALHEMFHSWDEYYYMRKSTQISDQSIWISLKNELYETYIKKNRPLYDYSYTNNREFFADVNTNVFANLNFISLKYDGKDIYNSRYLLPFKCYSIVNDYKEEYSQYTGGQSGDTSTSGFMTK